MIENRMDDPAQWTPEGEVLRTAAQVIIHETAQGLPSEIAAQLARVSQRTFRGWLQEGRAALARVAAQPDVELTEKELKAAQFATDVEAARAQWVREANETLERGRLSRQRVSTKTKTTALRGPDGVETGLVEVERTVTVVEEPVELGPLQWRMGKLAPAQYGPVSRVELTGADGGAIELDIGARVAELLGRIRGAIAVEGEEQNLEPAGPEQLSLEPGEPEVGP